MCGDGATLVYSDDSGTTKRGHIMNFEALYPKIESIATKSLH